MSEFTDKVKHIVTRPLFIAIAVGLVIRVMLIPMSLMYDTNFWTIVVRNMEAGYGLYSMEGYYYAPVWGYVIGFVSGFQNAVMDIGDLSTICYDYYQAVVNPRYAYSASATSIIFLFDLKFVLLLSDLLASILIYKIVKERTGDEKKSIIAFILVFLSPAIIGSSSVIVMPDTLSASFVLLAVFLVKKDKPLLAGLAFSVAVWAKFFPIALSLLLVCYIFANNKGEIKIACRKTAMALAGFFAMSIVLFLPAVINGYTDRAFSFLTDRMEFLTSGNILVWIGLAVLTILALYIFYRLGRHMCTCGKNVDDMFMEYALLILAICMLVYTNVQYAVTLMPFLVYCILVKRNIYKWVWLALAISGTVIIMLLNTNAMLFGSLAVYTDLISVEQVLSLYHAINDYIILDGSFVDIMCGVFDAIYKWSIIAVIVIFIATRLIPKIRRMRSGE